MCRKSTQLFFGVFLAIILSTTAVAAEHEQRGRVVQIAVGYAHICTLLNSGDVYCWGAAHVNGQDADSSVALKVEGLPKIKTIAAGQINSCAIDLEDRAWCWGMDLQASIKADREVLTGPRLMENLPPVAQLASGYLHNCAIAKSDGSVWCWGGNDAGELGDGTTTARAEPVRAGTLTGAKWISAGVNNSCAILRGGEIHCWGTDFQSGEGIIVHSLAPVHVDQSSGASKIVNGRNFFCSIASANRAVCFGSNILNQLGRTSVGQNYAFATPEGVDTVRDIGAGGFFACALTSSGEVKCWGAPMNGSEFAAEGNDPAPVRGLPGVAGLGVGFANACAILLDGQVKCWGRNSEGQLGNGKASAVEAEPVYVVGLPGGNEAALHAGKARDLKASRQAGDALREVNLAIAMAPDDDDLFFLRSAIYLDLQQQDSALADLDHVLSRQQGLESAYYERGTLLHAMGQLKRAAADLQMAVDLTPGDELARTELGMVKMHLGLESEARTDLAKVFAASPEMVEVYQQLGRERFAAQDYANALDDYDSAIALAPLNGSLYGERAGILAAMGDTARAQQDLVVESQVKAAAGAAAQLLREAHRQYDLGDFNGAIAGLTRALEINPASVDALTLRARAFRDSSQNERALTDLDAAIALDPDDPEKFTDRASLHDALGHAELALADLGKSIELAPTEFAYSLRAAALYQAERFGESIADFTDAIELDPANAELYIWRAQAYEKIGRYELMIADATKALELDENYQNAFSTRAKGYNAIGKYQEALRDYDRALAPGSNNPVTYLGRGVVYFTLGAKAKALADMEKASSLAPGDVYDALWAEIARRHMGLLGKLSEVAAGFDPDAWPFPLVELYLGKRTIEQVLAASASSDPKTKRFQRCEADFYGGEWLLLQGRRAEALTLFREANALCPFGFIEKEPARAEALALDKGR